MAQPSAATQQQERRPVICLGDSHTRGFYGASFLRLLRPKFPGLRFINAGHDGEPSATILARLPALLDAHPQPAAVTIFSGSNDCIAQESDDLQRWYAWQFRLAQPCSEQGALDNVAKMVEMVQQRAPQAKVIVITLPIMVEDPAAPANKRARTYSAALAQLMHTRFPSVAVVDFQAACRSHMAQHSPKWSAAEQQQAQQPAASQAGAAGDKPLVLTKYMLAWYMAWSKFLQGTLLGKRWNDISAKQGLLLLTDQIHINDTAAELLAELLEPQLQAVA